MKFFIVIVALIAMVHYGKSFPTETGRKIELADIEGNSMIDMENPLARAKRFTCDVFSFSSEVVTPNHAVCATKCIGMNRRGGHCEGTECICRTDKIIESLP